MKLIDIITIIALIGALASCSCSSCEIKHESSEPDTMPVQARHDYRNVNTRTITDFGYYTDTTDTAFDNAIAYEVTIDSVRYRTSRMMYNFVSRTNSEVSWDITYEIIDDSIAICYLHTVIEH